MNVQIHISLDQEDIDGGMTAAAAVAKVFPSATSNVVMHTGDPAGMPKVLDTDRRYTGEDITALAAGPGLGDEGAGADKVEPAFSDQPAPDPNVATDSQGAPWDKDTCSSNKKFYSTGPNKGRWQKRKGVDEDTWNTRSLQLAADIKSRTVATLPAKANGGGTSPVPTGAGPTPDNSRPPAATSSGPVAENAAASAGAVVGAVVAGGLPVDWPDFLKSLAPAGRTYADVEGLLPQYNITAVAELATPENHAARQGIAQTLGMKSQVKA